MNEMAQLDGAKPVRLARASMIEQRPAASTDDLGEAQAQAQAEEESLLVRYWHVVWRRKMLIGLIILLSLAAGVIATLLITPRYTATSRLEISRAQANVTNIETVEGEAQAQDKEFYETQYALLRARSLAERVARDLNLAADDEFFEREVPGATTEGGVLSQAQRAQRSAQAIRVLLDNVTVAPIRGSSLVDISYSSEDPRFAAQVANAWTEQFITSAFDRRFSSTADARRILEDRLAELRERLEQSERDLVGYASDQKIINLGVTEDAEGNTRPTQTLAVTDLQLLNNALLQATAARIEAEAQARQTSAANTQNNATIGGLRQKRAEAAAEYAKLMAQFEPEYPAAKAVASQIQALDSAISREEQRVVSGSQTVLRQAVEREDQLRQNVEALKSKLESQQQASVQYNIYQRDVDTTRQLYNGLLQRYKEIGVAGVGQNNIAVVDRAEVPERPSSPNLPLNLALALLGGLSLAALTVFALEQIDQTIKDPNDVQRRLGLPLIGTIPMFEDARIVEDLADQKSEASEAYLSVQTNLSFMTDHGVPKSLLVTSTRPAEGKSTTSLAISMMLARTGSRVLLIDADMRSPSIDQMLELQNARGLSNLLAGQDDWASVTQDTPYERLTVITTGPRPPNPAELLSSGRMAALVREAGQHFDQVVVDSPPVLGLADAPLLTSTCEGVIYTVEHDSVKVRGITDSLRRLQGARANILGVVLTKFDMSAMGYGYGYGYGYGGLSYGETREASEMRAAAEAATADAR